MGSDLKLAVFQAFQLAFSLNMDAAQPATPITHVTGVGSAAHWQPPSLEHLQDMLAHYEVLGFLGRGGMGAVYKARQRSLNRSVAIKILPAHARHSAIDFAERFKLEARAMARLNHPGIVAVHDFGENADGQLFIVMEFADGGDLGAKLEAEGCLTEGEALRIALQVCDALAYAHSQGVVHRDVKPANILFDRNAAIKVADFGLAKLDDPLLATALTRSGTTLGSQDFAAPEVFAKGKDADHRADVYSLGVMLYQMVTGDVPRGMFKLPSEKVTGLDPRLDAVICRAMEEDREDRYQSAAEMGEALTALRSPLVLMDLSFPRVEPAGEQPNRKRGRLIAALAAGCAVVALALGVVAALQTDDSAVAAAGLSNSGSARPRPSTDPTIKQSAWPLSDLSTAVGPSVPGGRAASDQELRRLAAWLFSLPLSTEPAHGVQRIPDLLLTGSSRGLHAMKDLPVAPLNIGRIRIGPLKLDARAQQHLEILARVHNLYDLRIYGAQEASTLAYVRDLTRLGTLSVNAAAGSSPPMPDLQLKALERLDRVTRLRLENWSALTGSGFRYLKEKRKLSSLSLTGCPDLNDEGLGEIAKFTGLRSLGIHLGRAVSSGGIAKLAQLRELEVLGLDGGIEIELTDATWAPLSAFTKLKVIQLGSQFPGSALKHLATLEQVEEITLLHNQNITDACLPDLKQLSNLKSLILTDTAITPRGMAELKKALPGCVVTM